MENEKTGIREIKKKVRDLLGRDDVEKAIEEIARFSPRQVVNPLFSFFYSTNELIKWRAVTAMGRIVAGLADRNMESARVIMRRLMWNLNDESGGIGWGSPEAMGEILAQHPRLAQEFHRILISYIRPDGNYIEHETLQRGVLWGIGRLAHARSELVKDSAELLVPYMKAKDPWLRGLAAWAAKACNAEAVDSMLQKLKNDQNRFTLYTDGNLIECTIGEIASKK